MCIDTKFSVLVFIAKRLMESLWKMYEHGKCFYVKMKVMRDDQI